jgi:hypothetical protein
MIGGADGKNDRKIEKWESGKKQVVRGPKIGSGFCEAEGDDGNFDKITNKPPWEKAGLCTPRCPRPNAELTSHSKQSENCIVYLVRNSIKKDE